MYASDADKHHHARYDRGMDENEQNGKKRSGDPRWVIAIVFGLLALQPLFLLAQWIAEILSRKSP